MNSDKEEPIKSLSEDPQVSEPRVSSENATSALYIDPEKEKAVVRKFDKFVLPQFVIIQILSNLDRTNIGNSYSPRDLFSLACC
jgi:hypothetical protein